MACGDFEFSSDQYGHIACLSPIRQLHFEQNGISSVRLFDYSLDDEAGALLDIELQHKLEHCLDREQQASHDLRWAPLAYQFVLWRLRRYVCLKKCIERFLDAATPARLFVSSCEDDDIVRAATVVAGARGVSIEFGCGPLDGLGGISYSIEPDFLPKYVDPFPVFVLYACWLRMRVGVGKILQEGVPLVPSAGKLLRSMSMHRWVGFLRALKNKFLGRGAAQLTRITSNIPPADSMHLQRDIWRPCFSRDEIEVVNNVLEHFMRCNPASRIDLIVKRLHALFKLLRPRAIVLAHDQSDYSRCLAFSARGAKVPVVYMPHGIVLEDYSAIPGASDFVPDGILAWSADSAKSFSAKGWKTGVVGYHRYYQLARPCKELSKNFGTLKVLVLMSEWIAISAAGREDCAAYDLLEIGRTLHELGVPAENVTLKFHYGVPATDDAKNTLISEFSRVTGYRCNVAPPDVASASLIHDSDLVVSMVTSGIYEAIVLGVPVVVFGMSLNRIGALADSKIPVAKSGTELAKALLTYNNAESARVYADISGQLRFSSDLEKGVLGLLDSLPSGGKGLHLCRTGNESCAD